MDIVSTYAYLQAVAEWQGEGGEKGATAKATTTLWLPAVAHKEVAKWAAAPAAKKRANNNNNNKGSKH